MHWQPLKRITSLLLVCSVLVFSLPDAFYGFNTYSGAQDTVPTVWAEDVSAITPEVTTPETTTPETTTPEVTTPEATTPEATTPETTTPEVTTPEVTTPEVTTPETTTPEATTPEVTTPEVTTPETTTPEATTPEVTTPETTTPEVTTPEVTTPETTTPEATTPETATPVEPTKPNNEEGNNLDEDPLDEDEPDEELAPEDNLLGSMAPPSNGALGENGLENGLVLTPTASTDAKYGDFELVLPTNTYLNDKGEDIGDGVASDMNALLYIKLDNTQIATPLYYNVKILDEKGAVLSEEVMEFAFAWTLNGVPSDALVYPAHLLQLTGLKAGTRVVVENVAITGTTMQWGSPYNWQSASAGVYLTNILDAGGNDISAEITPLDDSRNPISITENGMVTIKYMRVQEEMPDLEDLYYQTPSTETFETAGNHYASGFSGYPVLDKLLNSINVFSFNDIEGTHIVGPVFAQDEAYYKRENPLSSQRSNEKLIFADYSRGIPSYVGNITRRLDGGRALATNYYYDGTYSTNFIPPLFYTSESTWLLNGGNENWLQEFVVPDYTPGVEPLSSGKPFISPNNSGGTAVHHNGNYVPFATYQSSILAECQKLLNEGTIEDWEMVDKVYDSRTDGNVLQVNPGENWKIVNADNLTQININLPPDAEYFESSSPAPLTLNFECTQINPKVIGGKMASQFPLVTMNGAEFDGEAAGATVEFNEFGNRLIYNMPNIVTGADGSNRVVTVGDSQNIPGHMLLPQAEYWNYQENGNGALEWEGGNLNGIMLAKDVHMGQTEVHMWAYGGKAQQYCIAQLKAKKYVNGIAPNAAQNFTFTLNPDQITGCDLDGIKGMVFPMTAQSDGNGDIVFPHLVFSKEGTYHFILQEQIPSSIGSMTYDKTQYRVAVTVKKVDTDVAHDTFACTVVYAKIADKDGNPITPEAVDQANVYFNNLDASPVLPSTGGAGRKATNTAGLCMMALALIWQGTDSKRKPRKGVSPK